MSNKDLLTQTGIFTQRESKVPWGLDEKSKELLFKLAPQGIIAFDLETTGLSPLVDKIIEISGIKITPETIETFSTLINPYIQIPQNTIEIHGITNDMVKDAPEIDQVLKEWSHFAGDLPLIAHNARFDLGFLVMEMHQLSRNFTSSKVYCSCRLSRQAFKGAENHKLITLTSLLEIPLENHHRALDDALACLGVFLKSLPRVSEKDLKKSLLFQANQFKSDENFNIPEHLKSLIPLVIKQNQIDIKYSGGSYKNKFRPVKTLSLLIGPKGPALYALCLHSNMYKTFYLNKIKSFQTSAKEA